MHLPLLPHEQLQAALSGVAVRAEGAGVFPFKAGALAAHTTSLSKRAGSCGPQIVLNTGAEAGDMRDHLNYIYGAIYVECVLKNPAYTPGRAFRRAPPPSCPLRPAQQRMCKLEPLSV